MNFLSWLEPLSYLVTIIALPDAIFVFIIEQRKERQNDEEEIFQRLSDEYREFLKLVLDNSDLQLLRREGARHAKGHAAGHQRGHHLAGEDGQREVPRGNDDADPQGEVEDLVLLAWELHGGLQGSIAHHLARVELEEVDRLGASLEKIRRMMA